MLYRFQKVHGETVAWLLQPDLYLKMNGIDKSSCLKTAYDQMWFLTRKQTFWHCATMSFSERDILTELRKIVQNKSCMSSDKFQEKSVASRLQCQSDGFFMVKNAVIIIYFLNKTGLNLICEIGITIFFLFFFFFPKKHYF